MIILDMRGGMTVFNLPLETTLLMLPWPLIWIALALIMYFKMRKDEELEKKES